MRAAPTDLESLSAQEVLAHVVDEYHPRLYVACSFQKEASVILDMLLGIEPAARVFTLDTGVLFPETYEMWRRIEQRYGIEIDVYRGDWIDGLWHRDPDSCCGMRKVEPLERALSEVDAWITGLRRDQSAARAEHAEAGRGQRASRQAQVRPARRLEREGRLALHRRERRALPPVARPRLRLDRLHPLHLAGRRPRGALGRHRQDRVRAPPAGLLMDLATILFGLGVGLLVGITGMGGGSLMTPLLILVLGVKPVVAVGSDLAYAAITKTVGGWRHFTKGTVFPRMALWLAVGSCPAALAGVWVLDRLRDSIGDDFDTFMLLAIGGTLLLTGALVLLRALALADMAARERGAFRMQTRHKIAAAALGAVVGFVLGITSAGSGTLIAIGLILGFRLSPHRVVGTDVAHAAVLLWVAALAHVVSGNVDYGLAGTLLIGSIPGVWVGAHIATGCRRTCCAGRSAWCSWPPASAC